MENNIKKLGALASSADPTKLSKTVAGLIVGASTFIIWIAQTWFHLTLTSDAISNVAEQVGTIIFALLTIYGLIQKLVIFIHDTYLDSKGLDTTQPTPVTEVPPTN